jgi:hypothetical protein
LEGRSDVAQASHDGVGAGAGGHWDVGGKPRERLADAYGSGFPSYPDLVAVIGVHGWSDVPSVQGMEGPGGTGVGLFVGEHTRSGWAKGCAVTIKRAMDLYPSGELGIDTGTT